MKEFVVGYFNPNAWPININLSSIGFNMHLAQGQYITDSGGRKINDPIFEQFVKADLLSREVSKAPVAEIHITTSQRAPFRVPVQQIESIETKDGRSVPVFSGAQAAEAGDAGQAQPIEPQRNSVTGMSVEAARKLGILPRAFFPHESQVEEVSGTPIDHSQAPYIDQITARDRPKKANPGIPPRAQPSQPQPSQPSQPPKVIVEDVVTAKAAVGEALGIEPATDAVEFPEPNLEGEPTAKCRCRYCGKEFDFTSSLTSHEKSCRAKKKAGA